MGKGSKQRPRAVSKSRFDKNYEAIFGKRKSDADQREEQCERDSQEFVETASKADTVRCIKGA